MGGRVLGTRRCVGGKGVGGFLPMVVSGRVGRSSPDVPG